MEELKGSYQQSEEIQQIISKLSSKTEAHKGYALEQGILLRKRRIFIVSSSYLKKTVLQYIHENPLAGHSVYLKTYKRAKRDFFWEGMKKDIKKMVRECDVCQSIKYETTPPAGLLQPLPILEQAWEDISMDFIEGLLKSQGYDVIMVVVDRFIKFAHFILILLQL